MQLYGHLQTFKQHAARRTCDAGGREITFWQFTLGLEHTGRQLRDALAQSGDSPSVELLETAKAFLVDVEKWKAMCIAALTGKAQENSPTEVWECFLKAMRGSDGLDKLRSIMSLKGFGATTSRAKRATAVLRFLHPEEWGVVDWRTIAMLGLYDKCGRDMQATLERARSTSAAELRCLYRDVSGEVACAEVCKYCLMRSPEMPRAADVDMALFGASLVVWPLASDEATE